MPGASDVDGEMGVDVAHLVLKALCHTNDQVVDDGTDGSEGSDLLSGAMVNLDRNLVLLRLAEVDGDMAEVLDELSCFRLSDNFPFPKRIFSLAQGSMVRTSGSLDGDDSGLDVDLDCKTRKVSNGVSQLRPPNHPKACPQVCLPRSQVQVVLVGIQLSVPILVDVDAARIYVYNFFPWE